jgi:arylsulfatase A-like enzyme
MFTGRLPRRLGLAQPPGGESHAARGVLESMSERLLPQVLRNAGYATHGFSTNLWVSELTGFDVGFDRFRYVESGRDERMNALLAQGRRAKLAWAREGLRSSSDDGAAQVGRELRAEIAAWSGQPTFWFVNLSECHSPYLPPRPWNDLPPWERVQAAFDNKRHLNFVSICLYVAGRHDVSLAAFERMRHLYGRAVSYMDAWLGDVLDTLDRRGILDDTLVIVTSDHGENFGEDGLIAHGFSLDQRLVHVPLVMAGPGAGATDGVFSLADLPGLIARAADLDQHPWGQRELPEGVAIAEFDPMREEDDLRAFLAGGDLEIDDWGIDRLSARFTCATDGTHKLVVRNDRELVFDLRTDPHESNPLDRESSNGSVAVLRAALEHAAADETVAAEIALSAPAPPRPSDDDVAAIERQMKLLGYM